MDITFTHGMIVLEDGVLEDGAVLVKQGVVAWVGPSAKLPESTEKTVDLGGFVLSPGFIDLHVHGGGGFDATCADPAGLKAICRAHEAGGTTSLCLAVVSSPIETTKRALQTIAKTATEGCGGARVLGSYLEGPFLNQARAGAQDQERLLYPDLDLLKSFAVAADGWLRVVSLAPELPGADALIKWLSKDMGLIASMAHTSATCEQATEAIKSGCTLATHLFNGMIPFHHREPNAVGAILADDKIHAEIIVDENHIHPTALKMAYKLLGVDRILLITDAMSPMGAGSKQGKLGETDVELGDDGVVRRKRDGRTAGTSLSMIDAVCNMMRFLDLPMHLAVRCASLNPAKMIGIDDRLGSIKVGKHADLLVLDKDDLRVLYAYVSGQRIYKTPY